MKLSKSIIQYLCILISLLITGTTIAQGDQPNIVLIIADDLGVDVIEGFGIEGEKPVTPTLDSLRESGVAFTNCWATPQCTPTRAAILSGKFGIKTGVFRPPGPLDLEHESIFTKVKAAGLSYSMSTIGKWHVGNNNNLNHPEQHNVDHFDGFLGAGFDDYYSWDKVTNGVRSVETEYATSYLTDASINWIKEQSSPWFLWLAHGAPHTPIQAPPQGLYTTDPIDRRSTYFAMIEAMDHEVNRLIQSLSNDERDNTLFVFLGDNGTPNNVSEFYPNGHGKGSIYEGGLRVPLLMSGAGVNRQGAVEPALVQATDLHATILEMMGLDLPGGDFNSGSLVPLMVGEGNAKREINYSDYEVDDVLVWATRTDRYKLIQGADGNQEFYDIIDDLKEENNLINRLSTEQEGIMQMLTEEAAIIRSGWSCNDGIQNGTEAFIDDCGLACDEVDVLSSENIGCCGMPTSVSVYYEYEEANQRYIYTNGYPNHDFCGAQGPPVPNFKLYRIDKEPKQTGELTLVVNDANRPSRFLGVALNGVFLQPSPALPFVFENTSTGEYNWDWVFEPTTNQGEGRELVSLDCASAHTNSTGYHYHGNMFEYVESRIPEISTTAEVPSEPFQIGWSSDGFPILYRFGPDEEGVMKEMSPSFDLRSGERPGDGISAPCGAYTGKYSRDFEYITGLGDLDECNGISASVTLTTAIGTETFDYYYVITSTFPQLPRCMVGTVSEDFRNNAPSLPGEDRDGDGFVASFDCDDNNAMINPLATEIEGNDVDENCDDLLTSTGDISALGFSIYPNPNEGQFLLEAPNRKTYEARLYTITGTYVNNYSGVGSISFSNINAGQYTIILYEGGRLIGQTKVIVL